MLTNEQIEKLEPFTQHSKYGKLLQEAMNIWEGSVNPKYGDWGIYLDTFDNKFYIDDIPDRACCLIGASMFNKQIKNDNINEFDLDLDGLAGEHQIMFGVTQYFNISELEFNSLWRGFDNCTIGLDSSGQEIINDNVDEDAFQFGLQVRKVLFPDD